jgi:hypothetical protein
MHSTSFPYSPVPAHIPYCCPFRGLTCLKPLLYCAASPLLLLLLIPQHMHGTHIHDFCPILSGSCPHTLTVALSEDSPALSLYPTLPASPLLLLLIPQHMPGTHAHDFCPIHSGSCPYTLTVALSEDSHALSLYLTVPASPLLLLLLIPQHMPGTHTLDFCPILCGSCPHTLLPSPRSHRP